MIFDKIFFGEKRKVFITRVYDLSNLSQAVSLESKTKLDEILNEHSVEHGTNNWREEEITADVFEKYKKKIRKWAIERAYDIFEKYYPNLKREILRENIGGTVGDTKSLEFVKATNIAKKRAVLLVNSIPADMGDSFDLTTENIESYFQKYFSIFDKYKLKNDFDEERGMFEDDENITSDNLDDDFKINFLKKNEITFEGEKNGESKIIFNNTKLMANTNLPEGAEVIVTYETGIKEFKPIKENNQYVGFWIFDGDGDGSQFLLKGGKVNARYVDTGKVEKTRAAIEANKAEEIEGESVISGFGHYYSREHQISKAEKAWGYVRKGATGLYNLLPYVAEKKAAPLQATSSWTRRSTQNFEADINWKKTGGNLLNNITNLDLLNYPVQHKQEINFDNLDFLPVYQNMPFSPSEKSEASDDQDEAELDFSFLDFIDSRENDKRIINDAKNFFNGTADTSRIDLSEVAAIRSNEKLEIKDTDRITDLPNLKEINMPNATMIITLENFKKLEKVVLKKVIIPDVSNDDPRKIKFNNLKYLQLDEICMKVTWDSGGPWKDFYASQFNDDTKIKFRDSEFVFTVEDLRKKLGDFSFYGKFPYSREPTTGVKNLYDLMLGFHSDFCKQPDKKKRDLFFIHFAENSKIIPDEYFFKEMLQSYAPKQDKLSKIPGIGYINGNYKKHNNKRHFLPTTFPNYTIAFTNKDFTQFQLNKIASNAFEEKGYDNNSAFNYFFEQIYKHLNLQIDIKKIEVSATKLTFVFSSNDSGVLSISKDQNGVWEIYPDTNWPNFAETWFTTPIRSKGYMVQLYELYSDTDEVEVNEDNFPDENFRNAVNEALKKLKESKPDATIKDIKEIVVISSETLDTKGIEKLSGLKSLVCDSGIVKFHNPEYINKLIKLNCVKLQANITDPNFKISTKFFNVLLFYNFDNTTEIPMKISIFADSVNLCFRTENMGIDTLKKYINEDAIYKNFKIQNVSADATSSTISKFIKKSQKDQDSKIAGNIFAELICTKENIKEICSFIKPGEVISLYNDLSTDQKNKIALNFFRNLSKEDFERSNKGYGLKYEEIYNDFSFKKNINIQKINLYKDKIAFQSNRAVSRNDYLVYKFLN